MSDEYAIALLAALDLVDTPLCHRLSDRELARLAEALETAALFVRVERERRQPQETDQ